MAGETICCSYSELRDVLDISFKRSAVPQTEIDRAFNHEDMSVVGTVDGIHHHQSRGFRVSSANDLG